MMVKKKPFGVRIPGCGLILILISLFAAPAAAQHPFTFHDLLAMERLADPRMSPDGRRVAYTVWQADFPANRGRLAIHIADLETRSFSTVPTAGEADDATPRWSPDGRNLYFLSTRSGSQQVWRLSLPDGELRQITSLPLNVGLFEVSPDGGFLILSLAVYPDKTPEETREGMAARATRPEAGLTYRRLMVRNWDSWSDGTRNHLFYYPLPHGPLRDLMAGMDADCPSRPAGGAEEFALSPDGRTLVFTAKDEGLREAWSTNSDLFAVSLPPGDKPAPPRKITANPAADTQPRFSPDGRTLAYLAMSRPGHEADRNRIILRNLADGRERILDLRGEAGAGGDRSPDNLVWSPDGKTLYCTADHLGQHALFAVDTATGRSRLLMKTGNTTNPQPLPSGKAVLLAWNSLIQPTELYLLGVHGGDSRRITRINDRRLEKIRFGKSEDFTFVGARGDTVHGRLVYPVPFHRERKYPVALVVHGGPESSNLNEFHYRWHPQILAGAGYAVLQIDFHGSTGYGQEFTDAIRGDWGGSPYEDLRKGLAAALKNYPFLDADRMAALGPSYGGYLVNWLGTQEHRFRCLVSHAGIFDKRTAHYEMDTLWFPEWEFGDPNRHNPLDEVRNWRTPTLIIAGRNDYRVSYTQSLALFTALQRRGVASELLIFPDEGHWILKPQNARQWHEAVLAWLGRWLRDREDKKGRDG